MAHKLRRIEVRQDSLDEPSAESFDSESRLHTDYLKQKLSRPTNKSSCTSSSQQASLDEPSTETLGLGSRLYSDYLKQRLSLPTSNSSSTSSSQQGSPRRVSFRGISDLSKDGSCSKERSCSSKPVRTSRTIISIHDRLQERNSSQNSNGTEAGESFIRWTRKKSKPLNIRRGDMKKSLPRIEDNVTPLGCLSPVPGLSSPRGFRDESPIDKSNIDDQGEFRFPLLSINEESDEE